MSEAQQKIDEAVGRVQRKSDSLATLFDKNVPAITRRLPGFIGDQGERYAAIALSTINATPALRDCTPRSLVQCTVQAAVHGLTVDGVLGHAYLVPYRNRGVKEAQLQIGYRGFVEMIIRSGKVCRVVADVVYSADRFDYEEGTNPWLIHRRDLKAEKEDGGRGEPIAAYAIAHPTGGGHATFRVMSEAEVLEHRAASKAWQAEQAGKTREPTPWTTHPNAMWQKTAIRMLAKMLPMSDERYHDAQSLALVDEARDHGRQVPVEVDVIDAEMDGE